MTEREILMNAIEVIGEYSHIEGGEVVQTYSDLVQSIKKFIKEVGYDEAEIS